MLVCGCILGCSQRCGLGCRDEKPSPQPSDILLVGAAPVPDLDSTLPTPDAFARDALWSRAIESDDVIDLASLADREGAAGLLDAVESGGRVGLTALAALPMADDAPVAYRRLAQLALLTDGRARLRVLEAIHGIAAVSTRYGEPVDEGGREACAAALLRIARDLGNPASHRSVAISSLRQPALGSMVDASLVPTDLDSQVDVNPVSE